MAKLNQETVSLFNNLQSVTDNIGNKTKRFALPLGIVLVTALTLPTIASSGYQGPVKEKFYTSVADVLADPIDDWQVLLEGRITLHIGGDYYRFTDASGEIRIELEDEDMPMRPFDHNTVVRIIGEIEDTPMRTPMIEVDRVEITGAL